MANNQKPQNLEDELAENDSVYQNNTSGGNTIFDRSAAKADTSAIDEAINSDDIRNSQDPNTQLNALRRIIKQNPEVAEGIKLVLTKLLGGIGGAGQTVSESDKATSKGFGQYGSFFENQIPAVGSQIKKDIFGPPHPAEYGGKASIYKGIVDEENRGYKKGGKVRKKHVKGGLLARIKTLAINPK